MQLLLDYLPRNGILSKSTQYDKCEFANYVQPRLNTKKIQRR